MEYEIRVKVKVNAEEVSHADVSVNREDVVKAVADALDSYKVKMSDSITATGDWLGNYQVVGASWTCEVK